MDLVLTRKPPRGTKVGYSAATYILLTVMPQSVYVCFGDPAAHLDELRKAAARAAEENWTVNSKARPGDRAVFYMKAPLSSFVALGTVTSVPKRAEGESGWAGHYMADVHDLEMLPSPVRIRDVRRAFPQWPWLLQPRRSTCVPPRIAGQFLALLRGSGETPDFASDSDIEGMKIEVLSLRSTRSQRLRRQALAQANGVCCVCRRDFSQLLSGRGVRVLQVHHRKQLSSTDCPQRTTISDLAVVCANCHMLLHLDRAKPLKVEELRRRLDADNCRGRTHH